GLVQRIEAGLKPVEGKNRNDKATDAGQSEAAEHGPSGRFRDHRFHLLADGPVRLRARLGRRSPPGWGNLHFPGPYAFDVATRPRGVTGVPLSGSYPTNPHLGSRRPPRTPSWARASCRGTSLGSPDPGSTPR